MTILPYDDFINMIPEETKNFLMKFFAYLNYDSKITLDGEDLGSKEDFFYKAVIAYSDLNEMNASAARLAGLKEKKSLFGRSTSSEQDRNYYSEHYSAIMPFKNREAYYALTEEEILKNIFQKKLDSSSSWTLDYAFAADVESFIKKISKNIARKKTALLKELGNSFNKDFPIDVINYFDMAAKIYVYLKENYKVIKNIGQTNEELAELSMFLSIFYYGGVPSADGKVNEQDEILEFLDERGISASIVEEELEISIDPKELETMESQMLIQVSEFKRFFLSNYYKQNTTVGLLFQSMLTGRNKKSMTIPKLYTSVGGLETDAKAIEEKIKEARERINDNNLTELYKNLMPDVITFIKKLAHIYTYLQIKRDTLNSEYIQTDKDLTTASLLIASYFYDTKVRTFLTGNGIDLNFVLTSLGFPSAKEFFEELSRVELEEKNGIRFKNLVENGWNSRNSRERYTVEYIIRNLDDSSRTDSKLIHRLYRAKTNKDLNSSYDDQMNTFISTREKERKAELTESLLENVSIDVYNYLKKICSYYICLKDCKLSDVDHEQLSIIFAATRYNDRITNYLKKLGIDRDGFIKQFGINYSFNDKDFDIDIIKEHFSKYIFDRPEAEITVYSIFENAFVPTLKNSINLRKALFAMGHNPEDFLDIESKIDDFEQKEKEREAQEEQDRLYEKCDKLAYEIVTDAILFYDYINANLDTIHIVSSQDDIKEISMLTAILHRCGRDYTKYFKANGITFNGIMDLIDLNDVTLSLLFTRKLDKSLVVEFAKYLSDSKVTIETLIKALFNDFVNNSQILEEIVTRTGNKYSELKEEVQEKKDKPLSPEQRMAALTTEQVDVLDASNVVRVAGYGSSISEHSKYISEALRQLMFDDSIEHATEEINKILGEISYEETVPSTEKVSFFDKLMGIEPEPTVVKKYNPTKLEEVGPQMENQVVALTKELKGYEYLKKYIEAYLLKLTQYLTQLKNAYARLEAQKINTDLDELNQFIKGLDQKSSKEILLNKIQSFETMILLMKQELVTVHRAIISHFLAINSLEVSKMAILPLISAEMAISAGQETEGDTLKLTGELVSLLQNVVNKNVEGTKENLSRLRLSSISEDTYQALNSQIVSYLDTVDRGQKLLGTNSEAPTNDEPSTGSGPKF